MPKCSLSRKSLNEEIAFLSSREQFKQAAELQKEIDFLEQIRQKKKFDGLRKNHIVGMKKIDSTFVKNTGNIESSWNQRISSVKEDMNKALLNFDKRFEQRKETLSKTDLKKNAGCKRKSTTLLALENTMNRLATERFFSEASHVKKLRDKKRIELTFEQSKSQEARFAKKMRELEKQRKAMKDNIKEKFEVKIEEKKKEKQKELENFYQFYKIQKLKTQNSQIKDFTNFERELKTKKAEKIDSSLKIYGNKIRNKSALIQVGTRKTLLI